MFEQEDLFNLAPKEKTGEIQETEIEYLIIAFSDNKKREMIRMLEHLCDETNIKAYADYLFRVVRGEYEKNHSGI